jgi:peptidoglycan hydrolase CwlO-like protein
MIRFEQDPRAAIEEIICEEVRADIHGDLYNVDRAVDVIITYVDQLKYEIELLKAKLARAQGEIVDCEDEINDLKILVRELEESK